MNNKFFFYIALIISKITKYVVKLFGKDVFYYHGKVALKICPDFYKYVSKPEKIISVCGTNGKTSVCKLLLDFFKSTNTPCINNNGFNSTWGIASTLVDNVNLRNKCKVNLCVLETDELNSKKVFKYINVDYIIVGNLFRDFIRFNPHPYFVRNYMEKYFPSSSKLILNGDDVIVSSFKRNDNDICFGIDKLFSDEKYLFNKTVDAKLCPVCNNYLIYDTVKYHHIGKVHCSSCDFKSPICKYNISEVDFDNKYFILNNDKYYLPFDNITSLYNLESVICLLLEMGYNSSFINDHIKELKPLNTRFSKVIYKNKEIIRMLVKAQTSVSVSSVLNDIRKDKDEKIILFMLDNKNERDNCETISYYYESDFEFLKDSNVKQIIISGKRRKDLLFRLLMCNIDKDIINITEYEKDMPSLIKKSNVSKIYIVYDLYLYDDSTLVVNSIKELLDKGEI